MDNNDTRQRKLKIYAESIQTPIYVHNVHTDDRLSIHMKCHDCEQSIVILVQ